MSGIAQWNMNGTSTYYNAGKVGIGTQSPLGSIHISRIGSDAWVYFANNLNGPNNPATNVGMSFAWNYSGQDGESIINYNTAAGSRPRLSFTSFNGTGLIEEMTIINGRVGIGTTTPDAKLTVKGAVHSEEVRVDLSVPGPDYVFEETYQLPSLTEVARYIKQHKHLPEIPSAKEMAENGMQLGEMNMMLLKKIEELTLYVIEQNKIIEKLQEERSIIEDKSEKKIEELILCTLQQQREIDSLKEKVKELK